MSEAIVLTLAEKIYSQYSNLREKKEREKEREKKEKARQVVIDRTREYHQLLDEAAKEMRKPGSTRLKDAREIGKELIAAERAIEEAKIAAGSNF